ncbi:MAG: NADH dehydrogenase FAD-containing subunit [Deltaproteobacteria bacterium]|nr:NADH dehydrogenase FAD-containing subunit [Deltaproteobacteria bacterium]
MVVIIMILVLLAFLALGMKDERWRPLLKKIMISGALLHNAATIALFFFRQQVAWKDYVSVDDISIIFTALISIIFTMVAIYSTSYLPLRRLSEVNESGMNIYVACMLFFLATMTLAVSTLHIGVLWIAIESTTLASAPLIYYRQNKRSLEAAWKYLLICSVGIALALLGIFFVVASTRGTGANLSLGSLIANARQFNPGLLRLGFILILIGFGTKMGLAPMHNWLPDAHSEAPSPISALLSATLLNCALLGIIRFFQICVAAGLAKFASDLLIIFGLFSLFVAAVFISFQKNYKRLLAYSSVEHMGIIALGMGIGADFASLLHVVGHSLTKALLFLTAGNILLLYKTKLAPDVSGLLRTSRPTGVLFTAGCLAVLGLPPFLPFISEFLILQKGISGGYTMAMVLYLLFLGIIFVSVTKTILPMVRGKQKISVNMKLPATLILPPMILLLIVVFLGIYLPHNVASLVDLAARSISRIFG